MVASSNFVHASVSLKRRLAGSRPAALDNFFLAQAADKCSTFSNNARGEVVYLNSINHGICFFFFLSIMILQVGATYETRSVVLVPASQCLLVVRVEAFWMDSVIMRQYLKGVK